MRSTQVGTVANIVRSRKLPDGNIYVFVEGIQRGKILQISETEGFLQATVSLTGHALESTPEIETAKQRVTSLFEQYIKLGQSWNYKTMIADRRIEDPAETRIAALRLEDPAKLTDTIAANMLLSVEEKQGLLEIFDPAERLNRIGVLLDLELKKRALAIPGRPQT